MKPFTAIVCGGRDFKDRGVVHRWLERLKELHGQVLVIEGDATGADRIASEAAYALGLDHATFPANWNGRGRSAGPFRNRLMLEVARPDVVLAFPTAKSVGTHDMLEVAKEAAIPMWVYEVDKAP